MQRFSDCRVCGVRLSTVDVTTHELNCLQRSEENISTASGSSNEEDGQTVKNENNGNSEQTNKLQGNAEMSVTRSVSFVNEEDDGANNWEFVCDNKITDMRTDLASSSNPPSNKIQYEERKSKNSKPRRNVRSTPGCHAHNSKYSGRRASMPYDRTMPKNLFPPTKKYRYYPVTCEYCWQRFQPNELKDHQRKHHFGEKDEGPRSKRTQSSATKKGYTEEQKRSGPSKSVGAIPRRLQICYICGRMYGSKSLKLHEPKCLDKWRIQNDQLPPHKRAPEPVKLEPIQISSGGKYQSDFDPVSEAAFVSHLRSLIPCAHCSRTFSPDRIMKHESCCIERPKLSGIRQCITPNDGSIGR